MEGQSKREETHKDLHIQRSLLGAHGALSHVGRIEALLKGRGPPDGTGPEDGSARCLELGRWECDGRGGAGSGVNVGGGMLGASMNYGFVR